MSPNEKEEKEADENITESIIVTRNTKKSIITRIDRSVDALSVNYMTLLHKHLAITKHSRALRHSITSDCMESAPSVTRTGQQPAVNEFLCWPITVFAYISAIINARLSDF